MLGARLALASAHLHVQSLSLVCAEVNLQRLVTMPTILGAREGESWGAITPHHFTLEGEAQRPTGVTLAGTL